MNKQIRQTPVELPEGYIDFYKELESWENKQQIILKKSCSFEKYDLLPLLATNKKHLLQIKGIDIKPEQYKKLYKNLLSLISNLRPDISQVMNTLTEHVDDFDFKVIIEKLIENNTDYFIRIASDINVPDELFIFTLDHSLRPFLRAYAAPYQEEITNDEFQSWDFPTICPICGTKSHISRLRTNDGRRFMFCDRCFTEWEAKYLQCVHCGNNEPGTVKYMNIENDDAYQVYTCENCKGYLKTYDERQTGRPTDLYIANVETIYLDMLAQEKGYTSHDFD